MRDVGLIWLLPAVVFAVLVAVATLLIRRLVVEMRAIAASLDAVSDAVATVRADLVRARDAIDSLDVPSLRRVAGERTLGIALRWAARRVLPLRV